MSGRTTISETAMANPATFVATATSHTRLYKYATLSLHCQPLKLTNDIKTLCVSILKKTAGIMYVSPVHFFTYNRIASGSKMRLVL